MATPLSKTREIEPSVCPGVDTISAGMPYSRREKPSPVRISGVTAGKDTFTKGNRMRLKKRVGRSEAFSPLRSSGTPRSSSVPSTAFGVRGRYHGRGGKATLARLTRSERAETAKGEKICGQALGEIEEWEVRTGEGSGERAQPKIPR